jgi:UDP-glucose:(heptosyl)LPS alpha-1,3-glucosyltransferase
MRIALIARRLSLSHGGVERFSVNLARTLLGAGHEVHILAGCWDEEIEGAHYHRVEAPKRPSWLRVLLFAHRCGKLASRTDFDIVYGLTQVFPQDVHRMGEWLHIHWIRLRFPNRAMRWLQYLIRPVHLANLYVERQIYRPGNFVRILANSHLCKNQISQYYDVPPEEISVVYNGVDHDLFNASARRKFRGPMREKLGIPESRKVILFVSTNWKRKGLDTILRAMAVSDGYDLVVVGRGKVGPYRRKAGRLGVAHRVSFTGPSTEVERCYGAADLFVLPTRYDPCANVCLEALACGLPVVTTRANGAGEIVESGGCGRVIEQWDDAAELARAIEECLKSPAWEEMSLRALQAAAPLTLERNVAETLALFETVGLEKECMERARSSSIGFSGGHCGRYLPVVQSILSNRQPEGWEWVKSSRNSRVARCAGSPTVYYKEFLDRSRYEGLKALFKGSRCHRARAQSGLLLSKGFNSPAVLCWGKHKEREFMITEGIDALGLLAFAQGHWGSPLSREGLARKRAIIRKLGEEVGRLHREGIVHGDLRLNNVLVKETGKEISFYFIDNERNRSYGDIPASLVEKNLVQLGMISLSLVSLRDRLRFFRAYGEFYSRFSGNGGRDLMRRAHTRSMERLSGKAGRLASTADQSPCGDDRVGGDGEKTSWVR